jgi:hypothetical protein
VILRTSRNNWLSIFGARAEVQITVMSEIARIMVSPGQLKAIGERLRLKGLTMRDIRDCFVKALLLSAASDEYLRVDTFLKCWDYSDGKAKPTQFLIEHQDEPDFVSCKVDLGTWRTQDVYKLDLSKIDPLAVAQNLTCEIEKMMGIYPNIDKVINP